jgi:alkanesulfonate monooxygenase SsuD/methylene tetrahydromethanopterin reductase-like flavin-dependent oxidoreductase (luciferase family)
VVLRGLLAGETVVYEGRTLSVRGAKLGFTAPPTPVYLAALGPQMLRVAGAVSDGVTPNWSSTEQIVWLREQVSEAARAAGRDPAGLPFAQYIRVCVDDDPEAARRAFCTQVLGYAMARPGQPTDMGYRAHFGRMGFEEVLTDLEARRDAGTPLQDLLDLVPVELLRKVGYFGPPAGAAEALRRLSQGLDEAMVRLIAVRSGDLQASVKAVQACQPSGWR